MNVICCDDTPAHQSLVQTFLQGTGKLIGKPIDIYKVGNNGAEGVKSFAEAKAKGIKIDLITLDIRMPELDGLSALVKIRQIDPLVSIIMVSSEDEKSVSIKKTKVSEMPVDDRMKLLMKVVERVQAGINEPGKICKVLDACEELHLNPIEVAKTLKANGYIHKPYSAANVKAVVENVLSGGGFLSKVGI